MFLEGEVISFSSDWRLFNTLPANSAPAPAIKVSPTNTTAAQSQIVFQNSTDIDQLRDPLSKFHCISKVFALIRVRHCRPFLMEGAAE